jgi:osmotically-inducible protein OsmY
MKTDTEVKQLVQEELAWDLEVPDTRVGVAVREGVVTLTGHLDTYLQKEAAQRAAHRVTGVKAVAVELDVIPKGPHQRSDTEIATAIEHMYTWNTTTEHDEIRVTVEKGWVTLNGELEHNFQLLAAERAIHPVIGVVGITNKIGVRSTVTPANLSVRIQDALVRQAMREGKRIDVSVDGGTVTLRGHVHSWAERTAAEGTTWSAPGVSRVDNQLTVES